MSKAGGNLPSTQLELLPQGYLQARELLARATKIDEVRDIRNKAEAFRSYAIQARDREMEVLATELRMRSERRAGVLLLEAKEKGLAATHGGSRSPDGILNFATLKELGLTARESMAWQRIARIPDKEFEARLRKLRETGVRVTTNGFMKNGAFSSETNEHLSPPEVIAATVEVMGKIDLDPCAEAHGDRANVPARDHYTKKDDGLSKPWKGRVFMNPPYGLLVQPFVEYLIQQFKIGSVTEAIALVASRTETAFFRAFNEWPVCFPNHRLHFSGADNGAPFPSSIFYLGTAHRTAFERRFAQLGSVRPPALNAASNRKGLSDG
jgi:hypothetical protein